MDGMGGWRAGGLVDGMGAFLRYDMIWGGMGFGFTDGNCFNHSDATATAATVFVLGEMEG